MKCMVMALAFMLVTSQLTTVQGAVDVPKEALAEMDLLVGDWEVKGTINGEEFTGVYSAKWATGKHCLVLTNRVTGGIESHGSGIGGWSPKRKQYVETWYSSDGSTRTLRYSFGEEKGVWTGKITIFDKDGKQGSANVQLRAKETEFSGRSTGTMDGEKTEVQYICRKK